MLRELITTIEEDLIDALTGVKVVRRYKGEFEEGAETVIDYPAVLTRLENAVPSLYSPDGKVRTWQVTIMLYIAGKSTGERAGLDILEQVIEFFNAGVMSFDVGEGEAKTTTMYTTRIPEGGLMFYGYAKGVEVYTLMAEAKINV